MLNFVTFGPSSTSKAKTDQAKMNLSVNKMIANNIIMLIITFTHVMKSQYFI